MRVSCEISAIGVILAVAVLFVGCGSDSPASKVSPDLKSTDSKDIFVGGKLNPGKNPNNVDKEIDYVWDQIHLAGVAESEGNLERAAEFYERGFHGLSGNMENMIPGRSMSATYLIDIYKKLGRREEALKILKILEEKVFKSEFGKKRAAIIRADLLSE